MITFLKRIQDSNSSRQDIQYLQIKNKVKYQNLLRNATTLFIKKQIRQIKKEGIKFVEQADILDNTKIIGKGNFFVTLKDYWQNFMSHRVTKLINPSMKKEG